MSSTPSFRARAFGPHRNDGEREAPPWTCVSRPRNWRSATRCAHSCAWRCRPTSAASSSRADGSRRTTSSSGSASSTPRAGRFAAGSLELLKQIAPRVNRAALLFNPATMPSLENFLSSFKAAAASLAVEAIVAPIRDTSALESLVATQAREPNGGLIIMPDTFMTARHAQVASLAAHYRIPVITPWRFNAEIGGLISYGIDVADNFRRAAGYADRIFNGARPSELPVQAPVKFELVIN